MAQCNKLFIHTTAIQLVVFCTGVLLLGTGIHKKSPEWHIEVSLKPGTFHTQFNK